MKSTSVNPTDVLVPALVLEPCPVVHQLHRHEALAVWVEAELVQYTIRDGILLFDWIPPGGSPQMQRIAQSAMRLS